MSDDQSSALQLVTGPASEPISLAQAKEFLRIDHAADDDAITTAIVAVRQFAEHYLRKAFLAQTWDYTIANPDSCQLMLPFGPARSITSITLTTEAGATSTMNSANYRLTVDGASILFVSPPQIEQLTVRYSAYSYANAAASTAPIIQGMLHHIAAMMEARDGIAVLPVQAVTCYDPYRKVRL